MAEFLMSEFLSTVTADYAYTLTLAPQEGMTITPVKNQVLKYTDDGSPLILNLSSASKFIVVLTWGRLPLSDAETVMELWCDSTKADGVRRSFRWTNSGDSSTPNKIYVVNFLTQPELKHFLGRSYQSIDKIQLLVRGNYVP